jgi:hypothetical protein
VPTMTTAGEEFLTTAPNRYSRRWRIDRPAEQVWAELVAPAPLHWCRGLDVSWTSPPPFGVGTTRQAKVLGGVITVQERFFAWEEGRRYAFGVTHANLPLFTGIAEDYVVDPAGPDACEFEWTVAIEPSTLGKPGAPVNRLLFSSFFTDTTRYFGATEIG